jgi:aerobic-type carbon monoxide dehydrogenase small subunit (CoxS/CutS family)
MPQPSPELSDGTLAGPGKVAIRLLVNGTNYELYAEPRRTLLDALRLDLGLMGTKKGCDQGQCGACTVLMDGQPAYSCMLLAIECQGSSITTIEGLSDGDTPHPVQQALIQHDGLQCGFCTPGQVLSVKALLDRVPQPTPDQVRRAISGNLCRCGAYPKIVAAALAASEPES